MSAIPDGLHGRPFRTSEATALGITRRMLEGPGFDLLHRGHGVWAVAGVPRDLRFMLRADLLVMPGDAAVSHLTGLQLHGIDLDSTTRHWSTNTVLRRRLDGIGLHRRQAPLRAQRIDGIPVLAPDRCRVNAAIMLSHLEIVRIADALVAAALTTPEHFAAYAWGRHLHGVRRSRTNAGRVRERVRSFRETDLRLVLTLAGLPEPEINADIFDAFGNHLGCGDLVLQRWRIVLEYDGWYHERSASQRRKDILRREALEADGWLVIVVVSGDLDRPANLIGRVWRALVSRSYEGPAPRFAPWALAELARDPKA
ncbi:hypothetical protein [Aeromicrobium sp.]|uniref:hypothetical protein n=1 Tax=Aeromicrobium sp. TaxID=1871063 RepID=UPI0028AC1AB6|nr:hypothetical protein [Aeromicrobium sp.]